MKAKKFNSLLKKLGERFGSNHDVRGCTKAFFEFTGKEKFNRVLDVLEILESQTGFLGRGTSASGEVLEDVYYLALGVFSRLVRAEFEKTFSHKQLEKIADKFGGLCLVHEGKITVDMKDFWDAFYVSFLKRTQETKNDLRDEKRKESIKRLCVMPEDGVFNQLLIELRDPFVAVLRVVACVEKELFGTNELEKEFIKGFKLILKKAIED